MGNIQDIERSLATAEHEQGLYSDNERIIAQQLADLRRKSSSLDQAEDAEMSRLAQPLQRGEGDIEAERKTYERAREKFAQAEAEFRKVEEKFRRSSDDFEKTRNDARRTTDLVVKKYQTERAKIELEMQRKEREGREASARRINAERNVTLLRKRLEDARRLEIENLKRSAANSNHAPIGRRYAR